MRTDQDCDATGGLYVPATSSEDPGTMPELKLGEARFLAACAEAFLETFERDVAAPLRNQLLGVEPAEMRELREEVTVLIRQLSVKGTRFRVHHAHGPLIRRLLIDGRRGAAAAIEEPLRKAANFEVTKALRRKLSPYEGLLRAPWLVGIEPCRVPRLTDFLSVRFAEEANTRPCHLAPRIYDEKFHILEAPSLALPDLATYRERCRIRDAPVGLAYADIDDFKAVNTLLTETIVDAKVLPRFMEIVEAWVFAKGHAYRFGGDEYVLLLPNADKSECVRLLGDLLQRVAKKEIVRGVRLGLTVGLCIIDPDCFLTDSEILTRANTAKVSAKTAGKGRIGICSAPDYDTVDLDMPGASFHQT